MAAPWQHYVRSLCADTWDLDAHTTEKVLSRLGALTAGEDLTDAAVARALRSVGVAMNSADLIAPSIHDAMSGAEAEAEV